MALDLTALGALAGSYVWDIVVQGQDETVFFDY